MTEKKAREEAEQIVRMINATLTPERQLSGDEKAKVVEVLRFEVQEIARRARGR